MSEQEAFGWPMTRPPPLAPKSKPYPQTDSRRRRRTIHFGHNSPSHALTNPPAIKSAPHCAHCLTDILFTGRLPPLPLFLVGRAVSIDTTQKSVKERPSSISEKFGIWACDVGRSGPLIRHATPPQISFRGTRKYLANWLPGSSCSVPCSPFWRPEQLRSR